jgi:calcium-dependent protein kinase
VIAQHLSVEEVADIKELFNKMDLNHDNKISFEELKLGLHKLGHQLPDSDIQILMDAVNICPFFVIEITILNTIFKTKG